MFADLHVARSARMMGEWRQIETRCRTMKTQPTDTWEQSLPETITPTLRRHLIEHRAKVDLLRATGVNPEEEWRRFAERFDPDVLRRVVESCLNGEDDDADVDEDRAD